jgi:hypothetical protein
MRLVNHKCVPRGPIAKTRADGYTRIVSRTIHVTASLIVLGVLLGGPVAAVVCAEWCVDSAHSHQATSAPAPASDCHGRPAEGPHLGSDGVPACADVGTTARLRGVFMPRTPPSPVAHVTAFVALSDPGPRWAGPRLASQHHSPPRAVPASLVLRI